MTEADFWRQMEQTALGNTVCYTWAGMWIQRENYRLKPWEENSSSSLEDLEVPKTASLFPLSPTQGFLGHLSCGDNCTNSTLVFGSSSITEIGAENEVVITVSSTYWHELVGTMDCLHLLTNVRKHLEDERGAEKKNKEIGCSKPVFYLVSPKTNKQTQNILL